jgi:hypothetical protein
LSVIRDQVLPQPIDDDLGARRFAAWAGLVLVVGLGLVVLLVILGLR